MVLMMATATLPGSWGHFRRDLMSLAQAEVVLASSGIGLWVEHLGALCRVGVEVGAGPLPHSTGHNRTLLPRSGGHG